MTTAENVRGKVRKLKEGYGFIAGDDGYDYFFHWTAMQQTTKNFRELTVLDRVEFTPIEGGRENRKRAIEIRVIDDRPKGSFVAPGSETKN